MSRYTFGESLIRFNPTTEMKYVDESLDNSNSNSATDDEADDFDFIRIIFNALLFISLMTPFNEWIFIFAFFYDFVYRCKCVGGSLRLGRLFWVSVVSLVSFNYLPLLNPHWLKLLTTLRIFSYFNSLWISLFYSLLSNSVVKCLFNNFYSEKEEKEPSMLLLLFFSLSFVSFQQEFVIRILTLDRNTRIFYNFMIHSYGVLKLQFTDSMLFYSKTIFGDFDEKFCVSLADSKKNVRSNSNCSDQKEKSVSFKLPSCLLKLKIRFVLFLNRFILPQIIDSFEFNSLKLEDSLCPVEYSNQYQLNGRFDLMLDQVVYSDKDVKNGSCFIVTLLFSLPDSLIVSLCRLRGIECRGEFSLCTSADGLLTGCPCLRSENDLVLCPRKDFKLFVNGVQYDDDDGSCKDGFTMNTSLHTLQFKVYKEETVSVKMSCDGFYSLPLSLHENVFKEAKNSRLMSLASANELEFKGDPSMWKKRMELISSIDECVKQRKDLLEEEKKHKKNYAKLYVTKAKELEQLKKETSHLVSQRHKKHSKLPQLKDAVKQLEFELYETENLQLFDRSKLQPLLEEYQREKEKLDQLKGAASKTLMLKGYKEQLSSLENELVQLRQQVDFVQRNIRVSEKRRSELEQFEIYTEEWEESLRADVSLLRTEIEAYRDQKHQQQLVF